MRHLDKDQFLKDVATHQMTIDHDDGIYRHLRFKAVKNSWNMWFDLVTWPGRLTVTGDMGTWTFARVDDMFTFFRSSADLRINASYWSEKIQNGVHGGCDSAKVFDFDVFAAELLAQAEGSGLEGDELEELKQAVKDEVLYSGERHEALVDARDFSHTLRDGDKFQFDSCELPDGMEYSYHFIWCLYAIVWGIQQYDAAKLIQGRAA